MKNVPGNACLPCLLLSISLTLLQDAYVRRKSANVLNTVQELGIYFQKQGQI